MEVFDVYESTADPNESTADDPGVAGMMHVPVAFVWQIVRVNGRLRAGCPTGVSLALNSTVPVVPRLTATVTMTSVPVGPSMWMPPSWVDVSAIDTMSAGWLAADVTRNVFSPAIDGATVVFAP
jgi:hypothetical protein